MMPGMDGATLFGQIKKEHSGIVGLMVTAYPTHPRAEFAVKEGIWKLLSKALNFPELMATIDEAVGKPLILVVDDDTDLCANLWDLLREILQGRRRFIANQELELPLRPIISQAGESRSSKLFRRFAGL